MTEFRVVIVIAMLSMLAACTPSKVQTSAETIQLEPVSAVEAQRIRLSLHLGQDIEQTEVPSEECKKFVEALPQGLISGKVRVPENYQEPEGRKTEVFYWGRIREGKMPIVFFNGGPASSSHGSDQLFVNQPESAQFSWIYIDQRGTGCSSPFPTSEDAETVQRLTNYTSREIVQDAEVIREKLFGPGSKWISFGQSFGGLITHRYSIVAPGSLEAAFSHGFSVLDEGEKFIKFRVKSQKRIAEDYFAQFPGDREKLQKIRTSISNETCFTDTKLRICGPNVMDASTILLGFSTNWIHLHHFLGQIWVNEELNKTALETFVRYYVFGVYGSGGLAGQVIGKAEIAVPSKEFNSEKELCDHANTSLESEGEFPLNWAINECRLLASMANSKWAELLKLVTVDKSIKISMVKESLSKDPHLPFFLYSGQKDAFVPTEMFAESVEALFPRITYVNFMNSGHEGFYTEKLIWEHLLSLRPR